MAHDLYARLMHVSDNETTYPNISNHGFPSVLREYARGAIDKATIFSTYNLQGDDSLAQSLFGYIDGGVTVSEKLERVLIIEDIFIIHVSRHSNVLYPTLDSLRQRIGI